MAAINFTYNYPYTYYNEEKGRFTWRWGSSRVTLNGCYTVPVVFNSSLPKCSHINFLISITNTGSGTVLGISWDAFVYRDSYGWVRIKTFTLPNDGEYTVDCDLGGYNISKLAFVPSSDPGSSRKWTPGCRINSATITETVQVNELSTGMFQYGVFVNDYGVSTELTEVYANIGGTLTRPSQILANIEGQLVPLAPVYSAYWKSERDSMNLYKFIPPEDGTYVIMNNRLSGDHEIRFYDSTYTQLYEGYFYKERFSLTGGATYYITMTHYYTADTSESYLQIYKEA